MLATQRHVKAGPLIDFTKSRTMETEEDTMMANRVLTVPAVYREVGTVLRIMRGGVEKSLCGKSSDSCGSRSFGIILYLNMELIVR